MQSSENRERAWNYMKDRFGIERSDLEDFIIIKNSGDLWLASKDVKEFEDLEFETEGIRLLRITGRGLKPTTYGLQLLSDYLERNIVEVNEEELEKLLKREEMIPRELEEDGYVAIEYNGDIIGCGMYKQEVVSSRIPKGRGKELAQIINSTN